MVNSETLIAEDKRSFMKKNQLLPILEEVDARNESELISYTERLRKYFLYDTNISHDQVNEIKPVWHASFIDENKICEEYPLVWDIDEKKLSSLSEYLEVVIVDYFEEDESEILIKIIPDIITGLNKNDNAKAGVANYISQVKSMFEIIRSYYQHFDDVEEFVKKCDRMEGGLIKRNLEFLPFSNQTVFHLLHFQLLKSNKLTQTFIQKLKNQLSGIKSILHLQDEKHQQSEGHYDFANELLSLNEIDEIVPKPSSSELPAHRVERLQECARIITDTLNSYLDKNSFVFVNQQLANEYKLQEILEKDNLFISNSNATSKAKIKYKNEIDRFIKTISALKIADLEMSHSFDEELHHSYFERFDEAYLTEEDMLYFRPFIVIENAKSLVDEPKEFLELISNGASINFLTINSVEEVSDVVNNKTELDTFLELVSLAIIRRNAFVTQGGLDTPNKISELFAKGLQTPFPTLWNIMTHRSAELDGDSSAYLQIKTAIDSRYFPRLVYNVQSGIGFGTHYDISDNLQPDKSFPSYEQKVQSNATAETRKFNVTMADFFVANPNNFSKIEVLPSWYKNDNLIPLADYLENDEKSLTNKFPFIWIVGGENKLQKMLIPASWLVRFRQRLDYWQFLEELSGVKSNRLNQAIEKERIQWETVKAAEIENIKQSLQEKFNNTREADLEKAIQNILFSLLGSDVDIATLLAEQSGNVEPKISETVDVERTIEQSEQEEKVEVKTKVSEEVWIESDECTSCSDCINALPGVFKYNDDRQAFVHNPKGGPYAKIVAAAEKCPARCIHPGLPLDKNEADLDKWIKRAEKYN